jgi:hypothetical protein
MRREGVRYCSELRARCGEMRGWAIGGGISEQYMYNSIGHIFEFRFLKLGVIRDLKIAVS